MIIVTAIGADMSLPVNIGNKKKDILILGKDPVEVLDDTMLTAEKEFSINFHKQHKKVCLWLHYIEVGDYIFVNGIQIYKFKAKDSEINAVPSCLGNVSKVISFDNIKKTRLNRYVYEFSVRFDAIDVNDTLVVGRYLTKNTVYKCLDLLKICLLNY